MKRIIIGAVAAAAITAGALAGCGGSSGSTPGIGAGHNPAPNNNGAAWTVSCQVELQNLDNTSQLYPDTQANINAFPSGQGPVFVLTITNNTGGIAALPSEFAVTANGGEPTLISPAQLQLPGQQTSLSGVVINPGTIKAVGGPTGDNTTPDQTCTAQLYTGQ